jgi:hypothetical protein
MVPLGSRNFFAGIRETQCGDARAHGQEGARYSSRSDKLAGLAGRSTEAEGIDKDVAQAGFHVGESTEGSGVPVAGAKVGPGFEDSCPGISSFGDESSVGGLQRSAEIKFEVISGRRECRCQGRGNG